MMNEDRITRILLLTKPEEKGIKENRNWGRKIICNGIQTGWDKRIERDWQLIEVNERNFLAKLWPTHSDRTINENEWMVTSLNSKLIF